MAAVILAQAIILLCLYSSCMNISVNFYQYDTLSEFCTAFISTLISVWALLCEFVWINVFLHMYVLFVHVCVCVRVRACMYMYVFVVCTHVCVHAGVYMCGVQAELVFLRLNWKEIGT